MKKLFLLILFIPSILFAQTPVSQQSFASVTELRNVTANNKVIATVSGNLSETDGNGGDYMFNTASTAADDGFSVIRPTAILQANPGRWLYVANQNTTKGSVTFSGLALTFSYTVPFGVTLPSIPTQIHIQATSAGGASANAYVDKALTTTSTFTIKFFAIPALGVNNISFDWLVIKR